MAGRGVHFALADADAERVLEAAGDDEALAEVIEEIEEEWDEDWLVETDKAWDAIHRCLTDYDGPFGDDDFGYTWQNFVGVRELRKGSGRPTLGAVHGRPRADRAQGPRTSACRKIVGRGRLHGGPTSAERRFLVRGQRAGLSPARGRCRLPRGGFRSGRRTTGRSGWR